MGGKPRHFCITETYTHEGWLDMRERSMAMLISAAGVEEPGSELLYLAPEDTPGNARKVKATVTVTIEEV